MEFKGTKGKWVIENAPNCFDIDIRENQNNVPYVSISDDFGSDSIHIFGDCRLKYDDLITELKSNAKLIAASPEMFDLLKDIFDDNEVFAHLYLGQRRKIEQLLTKIT